MITTSSGPGAQGAGSPALLAFAKAPTSAALGRLANAPGAHLELIGPKRVWQVQCAQGRDTVFALGVRQELPEQGLVAKQVAQLRSSWNCNRYGETRNRRRRPKLHFLDRAPEGHRVLCKSTQSKIFKLFSCQCKSNRVRRICLRLQNGSISGPPTAAVRLEDFLIELHFALDSCLGLRIATFLLPCSDYPGSPQPL